MKLKFKLDIAKEISKYTDQEVIIKNVSVVSGGCINDAVRLETNLNSYFVKWNSNQFDKMFEVERKGLELLKNSNIIDVPQVICNGELADNTIFLVLEWIDQKNQISNYWEDFGIKLAKLQKIYNKLYGLDFDNYIGSLPQSNKPHDNWISFFINERIEKQIELAHNNKLLSSSHLKQFNKLYNYLNSIFPNEPASLLHGDLWKANVMTGNKGKVCIIDPAVYFGNREIEIAFTTLFGRFDTAFYKAYQDHYPLEPDFDDRKDIYNLYPLLVHLNLFGTSYLNNIDQILKKF